MFVMLGDGILSREEEEEEGMGPNIILFENGAMFIIFLDVSGTSVGEFSSMENYDKANTKPCYSIVFDVFVILGRERCWAHVCMSCE